MDSLIISATDNNIKKIVDVLKAKNNVIAINTDTVYGLIANANDISSVNKIYQIKNRDLNKPLGLFVDKIENLEKYVYIDNDILNNIRKNIDKSITYIFNLKNDDYKYLNKNNNTVSIRIPNNIFLKKIMSYIDFPLVQTSCNISNEPVYTDVFVIKKNIGKDLSLIVDGGKGDNISSTIIDITNNYNVIRQGRDSFELYS